MASRDVMGEGKGAVAQPRLVLVQHNTVIQVFPCGNEAAAHRAAQLLAATTGQPIAIYEVDARLPLPPALGCEIDPIAAGWAEIEQEQP